MWKQATVVTALWALGVVGCGQSGASTDGGMLVSADAGTGGMDAGAQPGNIVSVASSNPDLSTLAAAVSKAGLASTLSDTSKTFTVFAPTNAAFDQLFSALGVMNGVDDLTAEQLRPILLYHVVDSEVDAAAATTAAQANELLTTLGGKVQLSMAGSSLQLDGDTNVTTADVDASNGVIHILDGVLLPSIKDIATTDPRFGSLAAALMKADMASPSPDLLATLDDDDAASGFTVFAPTDDAFTALLSKLAGGDGGASTGITALGDFRPEQLIPVLTYHVLPMKVPSSAVPASGQVDALGGKLEVMRGGDSVTVDGVAVALPDVLASNGVIHAIGGVLLPSITDVVMTSPSLTSLKDAVAAADGDAATSPKVATVLDGTDSYTLLAPNDAAFTALGTPPSGQALTNVLLYHALPGDPLYASAALALTAPLAVDTALSGETVELNAEGTPKAVTVMDSTATKANVVTTDIFTSNGVLHVVDKVLIP